MPTADRVTATIERTQNGGRGFVVTSSDGEPMRLLYLDHAIDSAKIILADAARRFLAEKGEGQ